MKIYKVRKGDTLKSIAETYMKYKRQLIEEDRKKGIIRKD